MKNQNTPPDFTGKAAERYFVRVVSLILIGLLLNVVAFSQARAGFSVSSEASANGLGTLYSPGVFVGFGNSALSGGPLVQKRDGRVSGAKLVFEQIICKSVGGKLSIFMFASLSMYNQAALGRGCLALEQKITPEASEMLTNVRFNGGAAHAGFGLYTRLCKSIHLFGSMGAGAYRLTPLGTVPALYHDSQSASLLLRAGLTFNLSSKKSSY
jgi:hypothetical protein